MEMRSYEVAQKYVRYRYKRSLARKANITDAKMPILLDVANEEVKQEQQITAASCHRYGNETAIGIPSGRGRCGIKEMMIVICGISRKKLNTNRRDKARSFERRAIDEIYLHCNLYPPLMTVQSFLPVSLIFRDVLQPETASAPSYAA